MKNNLSEQYPFVSILAPCRNEVDFIAKAVDSILSNDYPSDRIEILVLDGMSDDGTRDVVKNMAEQDDRIKILDNPQKIVPTAMNIGIRAARGDYIVRIDCHASFASNYVLKCVEVSRRTGADNVGGYWETLPGSDTSVAKAIAAATSCPFGVGNSTFRLKGPEKEVDTVPFGTYRKEVFEKVGLYDERLVRNQDIELNSRIRKSGSRIVISPEIELQYYNRATFRGIGQQSFNNGLWNPYTIWLVGGGLSIRHFIPMLFVLGLAFLVTGTFLWSPVKWLLLAYILPYLSGATFFAAKCASQKRVSCLLVVWSFIVLHIAYGIGSLWAILTIPFKFAGKQKTSVGKPLADRKM